MAKQPIYVKIMSDIENQINQEIRFLQKKNYVNFITHLA